MSPPSTSPLIQKLCDELSRQLPIDVLPPVATSRQVAAVIGTSEAALSQERYQHKGIPYTKIGRRVRYLRSDVIEFLAVNRVEGAA
ncbi:Helix-turn-helix domain-containing protein [Mycolicibacterium fluoranthenivorans]|uniref:Helix-turn-helix domain-containing protein n=1 Tax=Mycolicibacterium fluoranthenivorans TaxID=258505 RepID=A0A1G4WKM6_9MYCO|nr:Helix-turn-helix domain-containing protein [Mycolicibacterium fluoranthenivorans]